MSGADLVRLGDVLEVQSGFAFKKEKFSETEGVPLIRIRDLATTTTETKYCGTYRDEFVVEPGDYLIGMDGEFRCHIWRGPRALLNQRVCRLRRFKESVDPVYVYYGIQKYLSDIEAQTAFVTVKHIAGRQIQDITMPLPAIAEQKRIVNLLLRADNIVRMRRDAQQKAKGIIPALFLDMFGDPAMNPKGWAMHAFGTLGTLDRGRSRHRPRDAAHLYGGRYPFVQTGDVTRSGGALSEFTQTYSDAGLAQSKLWPVGTLCITIAANIAETGILNFEACFPDSVVGFLAGPEVRIGYVQQWLQFLQPTLAAQAPQAAQKNINLEILRGLQVPLPPIGLQGVFAAQVERLRYIIKVQSAASDYTNQTFRSLLAGAFGDSI